MTTVVSPDCERTWIEEAATDPLALERLYNIYFPRLYAYACYRVGRAQEAEDVVADTFLKAIEGLRGGRFEWRHGGSFAAWLFRIAHNTLTDYHRRNEGRTENIALEDLPELQSSALVPEEGLLRKEQFAHLHEMIVTLSPRRQEIITLKFFGGLQNMEIAAVIGLDERTVASHLCRGLRDLHAMYVEQAGRMENSI